MKSFNTETSCFEVTVVYEAKCLRRIENVDEFDSLDKWPYDELFLFFVSELLTRSLAEPGAT